MKYSILDHTTDLSLPNSLIPTPSEVVDTLLTAEKIARKEKTSYCLEDLIGIWKLRFITGTKKTRKKAGIVLGAGRYIPQFIRIQIQYYRHDLTSEVRIKNVVKCGFLTLSLTGPVKFLAPKNILIFDFTTMNIVILGVKIYDGYIRDGKVKEAEFKLEKITNQAFFVYFLIQNNLIAARGKGGGLALWIKDDSNQSTVSSQQ